MGRYRLKEGKNRRKVTNFFQNTQECNVEFTKPTL